MSISLNLHEVSFKNTSVSSGLTIGWMIGKAVSANVNLAECHPSKVFLETLDEAVNGDPFSIYLIGTMYEFGAVFMEDKKQSIVLSLPENKKLAHTLFLYAESKKYAEASFRLGLMAHHGVLAPSDQATASEHFKKGAINGSGVCCRMLGIYQEQSGNQTTGRAWFIKGAQFGDAVSCLNAAISIFRSNYADHSADEALTYALRAEQDMPEDEEIKSLISAIRQNQNSN